MNPVEMVVIVVAIIAVTIMSVTRAKYGIRRNRWGDEHHADDAENERLREEVRALKDRITVLERIAVEKENSLDREIERLRDK